MSILRQPRGWGGRGTQSSPCPSLRSLLRGRTLSWRRSCWRSTPWDERGSLGSFPPGRRSWSWCSHTPLSALHSTLSESPGSKLIELRMTYSSFRSKTQWKWYFWENYCPVIQFNINFGFPRPFQDENRTSSHTLFLKVASTWNLLTVAVVDTDDKICRGFVDTVPVINNRTLEICRSPGYDTGDYFFTGVIS